MVEPAEYWKPDDPTMRGGGMLHTRRDPLPETLMRTRMVDVVHILREQNKKVSLTEEDPGQRWQVRTSRSNAVLASMRRPA
jgi:hypothetical protein